MPKTICNDALDYHRFPKPGKISVQPTKPCLTQRDLSLAYTPGVADPCLEIEKDPQKADEYTSRANLVGVISNGTAVLGLGNIGALASKPVMEGKGVLFKRFADIDVFDLEIDELDPMKFVETVARLEPTFGGINLEDIKAPDCFIIEEELQKRLNIPVLHDDQHGTAVILAAAMINALFLQKKKIEDVRIVCLGAGAAGFACMKLVESLGAKRENILMLDRKGVIHQGRDNLPAHKAYFATTQKQRTLEEAMNGADVFVGVSQGNVVSADMLLGMNERPIIFAMANPIPEIDYYLAKQTRSDLIMATGRSDCPNQINNVLGFPFLFRGALDARATKFNEEMKLAAVYALADLARESVPESVRHVYLGEHLQFGSDYILPKPFDPRLIELIPAAVAKAAADTGVARQPIQDLEGYQHKMAERIDPSRIFMRWIYDKAKNSQPRTVLPEGNDATTLRAAASMLAQGIAKPILIGCPKVIEANSLEFDIDMTGIEVIDPTEENSLFSSLADAYYFDRKRHGILRQDAIQTLKYDHNVYGALMVRQGFADTLLSGRTAHYGKVLRPLLQVLAHDQGEQHYQTYGLYMMIMENKAYLLGDCTVNVETTSEQLAELAYLAAQTAKKLGFEPRVAMLSFSNFGSSSHPLVEKVAKATQLVHEQHPDLMIDGEMQADTAVNIDKLNQFPFSKLKDTANVLIFPTMQSGNMVYKMLSELGGGVPIGPILVGLPKSVHVLQTGASVDDIVNLAAIAAATAN
ncbi:MAG: NADP-dependent malic enzyme [Mariprofundaceae bacterium]|nr:NADP-dependent malic enzyme [Mariprofundaceae bacterium]